MQQSLLLGCGNSREKKIYVGEQKEWTGKLVTIDMSPDCGADIVGDIHLIPPLMGCRSMQFEDESFDEIGAYDVLEHWGRQGDWRFWFAEFAEYWRILKPGGKFGIIVPQGDDMLVDPGHTRFIHATWFAFLNQAFYEKELARGAPVTDYRWFWKHNFEIIFMERIENHHLGVLLVKA